VLNAGVISMGGDQIGDVSRLDDDGIVEALRDTMPDRSEKALRIFVGYWRRFVHGVDNGDLVLIPLVRSRFAVARVLGPYRYDETAPTWYLRHVREVELLTDDCHRSVLDEDLGKLAGGPGTIIQVKRPNGLARLLGAVERCRGAV
jgi:predicted Mrr-cat superfamily restriction endonuclease